MKLYILVTGREEIFSEIFNSMEEAEQYALEWGHEVWEVIIKHVDVALPERMYSGLLQSWSEEQKLVRGWNACLDEAIRINGVSDV